MSFKLKGSPFQRNFGISPSKQKTKKTSGVGQSPSEVGDVGLNSYSPKEAEKTIQSNKHASEKQPSPANHYNSMNDPKIINYKPDDYSTSVSTKRDGSDKHSKGAPLHLNPLTIPSMVYNLVNRQKQKDTERYMTEFDERAAEKQEISSKKQVRRAKNKPNRKSKKWTPPWV
tara:strand:+ start:325 stop:840 length:516 start_codon:yes stop_codon:yes gene_type:complete